MSYLNRSHEMSTNVQADAKRKTQFIAGNTTQQNSPKYHFKSDTKSLIITKGITIDDMKSVAARAMISLCPCLRFFDFLQRMQMTLTLPDVPTTIITEQMKPINSFASIGILHIESSSLEACVPFGTVVLLLVNCIAQDLGKNIQMISDNVAGGLDL